MQHSVPSCHATNRQLELAKQKKQEQEDRSLRQQALKQAEEEKQREVCVCARVCMRVCVRVCVHVCACVASGSLILCLT